MSKLLIAIIAIFSTAFANETTILSFDGGGIRGAASLKILQRLQKDTEVDFGRDFEVYAGTSTGAIIAVSLACGVKIDDLVSEYEQMSEGVFSQSHLFTIFRPEYSPDKLKSYIVKTLEKAGYTANTTLGELPKKLVIPTVALDDSKQGRWRLEIRENITAEGGKVKVVDALLESTAAPTYFPSENGCVDGGMGMNDPSLAALMTLYDPEKTDLKDFILFSIGTGFNKDYTKGDESWGMEQWFANFTSESEGTIPLVSLLMDVEAQVPGQVCAKLLGSSYLKYDFFLTKEFALDAYPKIRELLQYTDKYMDEHKGQWKKTCHWLETSFK